MQSRGSFFNTTLEETPFFLLKYKILLISTKNSSSFILATQFLVKKSKQISGQGSFRGGSEVGVKWAHLWSSVTNIYFKTLFDQLFNPSSLNLCFQILIKKGCFCILQKENRNIEWNSVSEPTLTGGCLVFIGNYFLSRHVKICLTETLSFRFKKAHEFKKEILKSYQVSG